MVHQFRRFFGAQRHTHIYIYISTGPGRRKGERARDYRWGSLRHAMVGGPVAAAERTAKPKWVWEKPWRDQVVGAKMTETNGNKKFLFF